MNKELQTLERLLEKLATLRRTLPRGEQVWLDRLVATETPEVAAHAIKARHDSLSCPPIRFDKTSATYQLGKK